MSNRHQTVVGERLSGLRERLMRVAFAVTVAVSMPVAALAQTAPEPTHGSSALGLPDVPTTKILAIGRLTSKSTPGAMGPVLPREVQETVKLYLDGKIDQWYVRKDQASVVFILNVADVKTAHALLAQLPFGRADLMEFDLIPLGPLSPLAALGGGAAH